MRRMIAIALLIVAVPVVAIFGMGQSDDDGNYQVRAIFDNVRLTKGEDVKIAGAKVGDIEKLELTDDNKAAVVLNIDKPGFTPFKRDASCTVRPQSLIGETFVECVPGTAGQPELREVPEGEDGEGEHLLPVDRNASPVDIDLINNTLRRPYRERLGIILNEFGAALAGRGRDLNEVIRRANPALRETDEVLKILAGQNKILGDLARNSDTVIAPLSRERERISDFIVQANATGEATAERRADISRSIERLPRFLPELRGLMADLGRFADEQTPVLRDLHEAAPDLNRFIAELGPFSRSSLISLDSLGEATEVGLPAIRNADPIVRDLEEFAEDAAPVALNLDEIAKSLDENSGIDNILDYIFFQMTAINGFDGVSHYLRANLLVNLCSTYAVTPTTGCNANFSETRATSAGSGPRDKVLDATAAALRGEKPKSAAGKGKRVNPSFLRRLLDPTSPAIKRQREARLKELREQARRGSGGSQNAADPVLDYLLGNDG
jgi:phospholipid/cholesterol/gamma-HCH transport system substrate-binding protein